jgi:hypothetical protein
VRDTLGITPTFPELITFLAIATIGFVAYPLVK